MSSRKFQRNVQLTVLGEEKAAQIHEAALKILAEIGMKIQGERTLALLHKSGCRTDAGGLTRIPKDLVESALASVPKKLVLYNRGGEPQMVIDGENQVYFGTHADQLQLVDPQAGKIRKFLKADIATMCRIADALTNIDFVLSVGMAADVSPLVQSQVTFVETVKNFSKTINFSTNNVDALLDIIEIAAQVTGGLERLQEKPFIFNYCEPIPPCTHPASSTEKLYISAENRIPVVYMPYCMMGGTSTMDFAATLAQCHAEVLCGLVISQLVSEGAPFIYGAMPSVFDMRTTIGSYGAPEFHLLVAASSELAAFCRIPFYGTAGCSDAAVVDEQAVFEATFEIFSTLLSRAHLIHDVGVMDHCNSVSPEMVVLADEIITGLKHFVNGVDTSGGINLEVLKEVGPGGHFLSHRHTRQNFRKVWYPELFSREMENKGQSRVREKVVQKIADIMASHVVAPLPAKTLEMLDQWSEKLEKRAGEAKK